MAVDMPLLSLGFFAVLSLSVFFPRASFSLEEGNHFRTWHSYVFNPEAGNKEGLNITNLVFSDFGSKHNIQKWKVLEDQYGAAVVGMGKNFIEVTVLSKGNISHSFTEDVNGYLSDIVLFQSWSSSSQHFEKYMIIASCDVSTQCILKWYQIHHGKLVLLWSLPFLRIIKHMSILNFNGELKLLIISESNINEVVSAEVYSFSSDQIRHFWLYDRFALDESPSATQMFQCNDYIYLSFAYPKMEMVFIYKYHMSHSGWNHFKLYLKFSAKEVTSLSASCFGFHCYLAVASLNSTVYKFNGNSELTPITNGNFGKRMRWLILPLNTYNEKVILIGEGENDIVTILLTRGDKLHLANNLSRKICQIDDECSERTEEISLAGAALFFYDKSHCIVFTSNLGNSKTVTFNVEIEQLRDKVEMQLQEIYSFKSRLMEKLRQQEDKIRKLDEAVRSTSSDIKNISKVQWVVKNLKVSAVSVSERPDATINSFEFASNRRWEDNDYSVYLDLLNKTRPEDVISSKIFEVRKLFQDFEEIISVKSTALNFLSFHDVSFLGTVTVRHLELSHINGIDVNDMLQNSYVRGSDRKIGGIKTISNIHVDRIFFDEVNDIPASDIIFTDQLLGSNNIINGTLIYENDLEVLNEFEFLPGSTFCENLKSDPFNHGFSVIDEIVFENVVVSEDAVIKETINEQPLILPIHNSPFNIFSSESVNQVRIETIYVENNLTVGFINGKNVSKLLDIPQKTSENYTADNRTKYHTINLEIDYLNGIKFPEGFVHLKGEKNINLKNKNFSGELITQTLHIQDEESENYLRSLAQSQHGFVNEQTFESIEVHAVLVAKMVNGYSWEMLSDILQNDEEDDVQITGVKHLKNCQFSKHLTVKNSEDFDNILNNFSEQELVGQVFNSVTFRELNMSGRLDGVEVGNLKESTVRLSDDKEYQADLIFEDGVVPNFNKLFVLDSINNSSKINYTNDGVLVMHGDVTWEKLNTTNLIVNGNLNVFDKINNVSLNEFNLKHMAQSQPELDYRQSNENAENTNTGYEDAGIGPFKTKEDMIYELLNSGFRSIKSLVVEGNITTERGVNGYNLTDYAMNAINITRTNVVKSLLIFEDPVKFKKLRISGRLQGFDLKSLKNDLVYDTTYVFLKGEKNFVGNPLVVNKVKARTLNGHLLQNIITKEGDHYIKGPIKINGDVRVIGNITSYGSINGFPVSELLRRYSVKHDSFVFDHDVQLQVSEIDHLHVEGLINNNSFSSFLEDVAMINDGSEITAKKIILGSVNFEKDIHIKDTLNGLDISRFNEDIILMDEEEIDIPGDIIIGKSIIQNLEVKGDMNSTLVHGFDTNEWLEEAILLDKSVTISGSKKFTDVYSYGDIETDNFNNYLTTDAIPLNKDQFIPCSGYFQNLTSYSDIVVEGLVNDKVLGTEYADSVFIDEEQEISGPITFLGDVVVEKDLIVEDEKSRDLLNVTTLYTNQTISSIIIFQDTVIVNSKIEDLKYINDIDIKKWNAESITLNSNQVIKGSWIVEGNVTVLKSVKGKGLINGKNITYISQSIREVEKAYSDFKSKRDLNLKDQCETISNFSKKVSAQPSIFHHFEVFQILKPSANIETVISFKAKNNHYLMLTFIDECLSILYRWNDTIHKFNYLNRMHIGPVSKWMTIYSNEKTYLVTSSSSDMICEANSKRGNIWVFDGDHSKYGHLFTTDEFKDIISSDNLPGKYYTLKTNGDVIEWSLEPKLTSSVVTSLSDGNYEFVNFDVLGELAFTDGIEIKDKQNKVVHRFSKPLHGRIAVNVMEGETLIVVPYEDELVVYEDLFKNKIYGKILASKVGSILWLNQDSKHPHLLYEANRKFFEIIHFKGPQRLLEKISVPIPSHKLILTVIPREVDLRPRELVVVLQKKKILLLEAHYLGNMYSGKDHHCE